MTGCGSGMVRNQDLPAAPRHLRIDRGPQVRARFSGRMRTNRVRVAAGDRVSVELTPYGMFPLTSVV